MRTKALRASGCLIFWAVAAAFSATAGATPSDPQASPEARALFSSLQSQMGHGILFGQQNANLEGVGWHDGDGVPDVRKVSGADPAVFGFDFADRDRFDLLMRKVIEAHDEGAVITVSWHLANPVTGGSVYDLRGRPVHEILPGGSKNAYFLKKLRAIAKFAKTVRGKDGKLIPIIFRPFHEHNGNWFWWGTRSASEGELRSLVQYTVQTLRNDFQVHNFLYAYSPDWFLPSTRLDGYFYGYPGDEFVDVLGLDDYRDVAPGAIKGELIRRLRVIVSEASARGKLAALTETGLEGIRSGGRWKRILNWSGDLPWQSVKPLLATKNLPNVAALKIHAQGTGAHATSNISIAAHDANWARHPGNLLFCEQGGPGRTIGQCADALGSESGFGFEGDRSFYGVTLELDGVVPDFSGIALFQRKSGSCSFIGCWLEVFSIPDSARQLTWWTERFASRELLDDPIASRIAYMSVWRNASAYHHYAPYPGHFSADDFVRMKNERRVLFAPKSGP